MAKKERMIIIFLLGLGVLSFCSAVVLTIITQREKTLRIEAARLLDRTIQEKKTVEKRLEEINSVRLQLESGLKKTEIKITDLETKLKEIEAAKIDLSSQLSEKEKAIGQLNIDFENEKKEKTELANKLMDLEKECKSFKVKVEQLEAVKAGLEKRLEKRPEETTSNKAQLEKIVVKPVEAPSLSQEEESSSIEGRILVINREFDFVVINLGQEDEVKLGSNFLVYKDEELMGKIEVVKLYKDTSIATFLPEARKEEIKEGDIVRMLLDE